MLLFRCPHEMGVRPPFPSEQEEILNADIKFQRYSNEKSVRQSRTDAAAEMLGPFGKQTGKCLQSSETQTQCRRACVFKTQCRIACVFSSVLHSSFQLAPNCYICVTKGGTSWPKWLAEPSRSNPRPKNFPKILHPPPNSRRQTDDMKQHPYSGLPCQSHWHLVMYSRSTCT